MSYSGSDIKNYHPKHNAPKKRPDGKNPRADLNDKDFINKDDYSKRIGDKFYKGSGNTAHSDDAQNKNPRNSKEVNRYVEVGKLLSEARRKINLDLSEISAETRIRQEFLVMVEKGDYEEVNKRTYYYGCVRLMANMCGLSGQKILNYLLESDDLFSSILKSQNNQKNNKKHHIGRDKVKLSFSKNRVKLYVTMTLSLLVLIGIGFVFIHKRDTKFVAGDRFLKELSEFKG